MSDSVERKARADAEEILYQTVEEERILLKYLFTKILVARKFFTKVKEEVFTTPTRVWLFRKAKEIFRETNAMLDEDTIKAELDRVKKLTLPMIIGRKSVVKSIDHVQAMGEWNLIYAIDLKHTPEWLIDDLDRKKRAQDFFQSTEKAVQKVLEGDSDEAIDQLNSDLIQIKSGVFTEKPLRRLSDPTWQIETIKNKKEHPEQYAGIDVGFDSFDRRAGAYRGELILITAHTGVGKSTLMRSMAMGAAAAGNNVLFIVNEEIEDQAGNKLASIHTKFLYRDLKAASLDDSELKKFEEGLLEFGDTHGEVFIQELPQFHTCAEIEQILVDLEQQGERIDIVILDYLDHLKPMEKSWSEVDEQSKAIAEFKNVCTQYRVAGITATQADTSSVDTDTMHAYNVRGSKQKSGAANVVMAIKEIGTGTDDKDTKTEEVSSEAMTWKVMIIKNRDGGKFYFYARFHRTTGEVREYNEKTATAKEREEFDRDLKAHAESSSKSKGGRKRKSSGSKEAKDIKKDGLPKKEEGEEEHKPVVEKEEVTSIAHKLDDISDEELSDPAPKRKLPPGISRSASSSADSTPKKKIVRKAKNS
jgi:replicative DNA helicase